MNFIAFITAFQVFLKLLTLKDVFNKTHKRSCFWKPFGSQHVNESQKLVKSAEKHFYHTFLWLWAKLNMKKSFLVRSKILGQLSATCEATSVPNLEN